VAVAAPPQEDAEATVEERTATPTADAVLERPRSRSLDFSTYVQEALQRQGSAAVQDGQDSFERVGLGTLYRSGEVRSDDPGEGSDYDVLGLTYSTVAPRTPVHEDGWAGSLRAFGRGAVWLLPVGVVFLALSSVFGAPTATSEPSLVSPGTWVVVTTLGLGLWLGGVVALAALTAATRVRRWGMVAVLASALGVALLGPVVGVDGFARPAIARTARGISDDPNIGGAAGRMQHAMLSNAAGRWLIVGGGLLLAIGAVAVVVTILGSRVLQRHDGWLMLIGVGLALAAGYLAWGFLFTLAAMVMLAGALGLAYTASRIAPDGTPPPAY
jgi:hypothetical protein